MSKLSQDDIVNKLKSFKHLPKFIQRNDAQAENSSWNNDIQPENSSYIGNHLANNSSDFIKSLNPAQNILIDQVYKDSKFKFISVLSIYVFLTVLTIFGTIYVISLRSQISNDIVYSKLLKKFVHVNADINDLIHTLKQQAGKPTEDLKNSIKTEFSRLAQKHLFLDAYTIIKIEQNKRSTIGDEEIEKNILIKYAHKIDKNIIINQNIMNLIHDYQRPIYKNGFIALENFASDNVFFIQYLFDDYYIFMNLNIDILKNIFSSHRFHLLQNNPSLDSDIFKFDYIKNITHVKVDSHSKLAIYWFPLFIGLVVLGIINYVFYLVIYSVKKYYGNISKVNSLNNELDVAQETKNEFNVQVNHLIETLELIPWRADPNNNAFTFISPQISQITGIPQQDWMGKGFWLTHIHEDDREFFFKAIRRIKNEAYVNVEYRIYNNHGDILWLRNMISEKVSYDPKGTGLSKVTLQGLISNITDEKRVIEALEKAKIDAEQASQMKSNFLASMSHELRTPLNSIIGFSDFIHSITQQHQEGCNINEYANNILLSAKHLLHLINDILDYSKIEAGKFEVHIEPASIADIFESCQVLLKDQAATKNVSLIVKPPPEMLYLNIDSVRIKQVLINLMTNAIKFNRPEGKVALKLNINEAGQVIISIIDTGIGMKPEDVNAAFEKFRQIDDSKNRQQEGTGLGLSISKSLVELHGGEMHLNSIYGKGTKITIIFPPSVIYDEEEPQNIVD